VNLSSTEIAVLLLVALIGREIVNLATRYFFKKVTRDDYVTKGDCQTCQLRAKEFVTKSDCEACAKQDDSTLNRLTADMSTVKGILLVMAVKQGVPAEDLKGLTR
jgi:hypothetical protein